MGRVEDLTARLVEHCRGLSYNTLPITVIDRVKYFFLDYLGVCLRGSLTDSSQAVYRFIAALDLPGSATMIGRKEAAPFLYAALANGAAAHSLEMDDTHREGSIHLGVAVFSALLAGAEHGHVGPRPFIAAAAVGYEVAARLAMALGPTEQYRRGFHPTGTCGALGAAAAVSHLWGLGAEETLSALGIAGSQAAGSMEFLRDGSWTKRLHPGWAAFCGIQAALLARSGFRGPRSIIEGRDGFLHAHSEKPQPQKVVAGLGEGFEILRTSVKPYACCRYMQAPIDALLDLVERYHLTVSDIDQITIGILDAAFPIICEPREKKYRPASVVDAQFSMPFGAAVAVVRKGAGLEEYTPECIEDPQVRALMQRVVCVRDAELEKRFPREWPAWVTVRLRDGREVSRSVDHPRGDPENPLTWEEIGVKFRSLGKGILSPSRLEQIASTLDHLQEERDMAGFAALLRP